jgi:hypothetical protein
MLASLARRACDQPLDQVFRPAQPGFFMRFRGYHLLSLRLWPQAQGAPPDQGGQERKVAALATLPKE